MLCWGVKKFSQGGRGCGRWSFRTPTHNTDRCRVLADDVCALWTECQNMQEGKGISIAFNFQRLNKWLHRFEFDTIHGAYNINCTKFEIRILWLEDSGDERGTDFHNSNTSRHMLCCQLLTLKFPVPKLTGDETKRRDMCFCIVLWTLHGTVNNTNCNSIIFFYKCK